MHPLTALQCQMVLLMMPACLTNGKLPWIDGQLPSKHNRNNQLNKPVAIFIFTCVSCSVTDLPELRSGMEMMTTTTQLAEQIEASLKLLMPPIAISFANQLPNGIDHFEGAVPAGCSFWELAASQLFSTTAGDHELCSIGVHTHNLTDASPSQSGELQTALQAMTGLDYVREDEIAQIPVMPNRNKYTIYGPLADFPTDIDVVLLFADSQQGLCITEAVARVDAGTPPAMGRPACAVIPQVVKQGSAAMSLGCCGARAYLDALGNQTALWALPGSKLAAYAEQLGTMAKANSILTMFHNSRKSDVIAGKRPSVEETLEGMS